MESFGTGVPRGEVEGESAGDTGADIGWVDFPLEVAEEAVVS